MERRSLPPHPRWAWTCCHDDRTLEESLRLFVDFKESGNSSMIMRWDVIGALAERAWRRNVERRA